MLINKRKFDIRVWVLLTQDMDLYFFREGYLRLSSKPFTLDNFQDEITHLTNVAIQKYCKLFGKTEDGNQLSFADLRSYMRKTNCRADFDRDVMPQIKQQTVMAFHSVAKKLNPHRQKSQFELFGLDYMLDADCNCWLLEVNTNPCLDEDSKLLKIIIPRMLDDMFKLTVD